MAAPDDEPGCAAAEALKAQGARLFKLGDYTGADKAYAAAVEALPASASAWSKSEHLLLVLHSNRAMCLLKGGEPERALGQCRTGLALPGASRDTALHSKLMARHVEALLGCSPPRQEDASEAYAEARARGLLVPNSGPHSSRSMLDKWAALVARLETPPPERAAHPGGQTLELVQLIKILLKEQTSESMTPEMLLMICTAAVTDAVAMRPEHVCSVDSQGQGTLLWALCTGFAQLTASQAEAFLSTFLKLLDLFVKVCGAPVDQRMEGGKTALMLISSSHCPGALRAVCALGASPLSRDDGGWTALQIACADGTEGPQQADDAIRQEKISILLEAGCEVGARNGRGSTALHLACLKLKPSLVATLLQQGGADPEVAGMGAFSTPMMCVMQAREVNPQAADECIALLQQHIGAGSAEPAAGGESLPADARAVSFVKGFLNQLVKINNEWNEKLGEEFSNPATGEFPADGSVAGHKSAALQELEVAKAIFAHFGMDGSVLEKSIPTTTTTAKDIICRPCADGAAGRSTIDADNWYGDVHAAVMDLIPAEIAKVYPSKQSPTVEEWRVLTANHAADEADTSGRQHEAALLPHPEGVGLVSDLCVSYYQLVNAPLTHSVSFAVPNEAALAALAALSPLVEAGAGAGYWAALLRRRGADIKCFDIEPPSLASVNNRFQSHMFTHVDAADAVEIFSQGHGDASGTEMATGRTLLLIYPESPAHVAAGDYESWDCRCLSKFHAAGGETVAYVGEREGKALGGGSYPWGISSSCEFQDFLQAKYFLDKQVDLPNWLFQRADLTVWRRKAGR